MSFALPAPARSVASGAAEEGPFDPRLRGLVLALLLIKLAVTVWNCATFDGQTYDQAELAIPRARTAGLSLEGRTYNPPLYYMATLPLVPVERWLPTDEPRSEPAAAPTAAARRRIQQEGLELLRVLRWTNLGHLAVFYLGWIYGIFPHLLGRGVRWTLASALLLALPGFQKLAAMVHGDNALASFTAATIALWLLVRGWPRPAAVPAAVPEEGSEEDSGRSERRPSARRETIALWSLAAVGGLAGLTRPFGALTSAAACGLLALLVARRWAPFSAAWLVRTVPLCALVVALASSWYLYQYAMQGGLSRVNLDSSEAKYAPHRAEFDRVRFFTTFYIADLLRVPNAEINELDRENPWPKNRYGNSFFTSAYSELWGDHWRSFSSASFRNFRDVKLWPKRVVLAAALPLVPLFLLRFGRGVLLAARDVVRRVPGRWDTSGFLLLYLLLGAALYLAWQQFGGGLTPGKNSGVKFIYVAYLVPLPIALAFLAPLSGKAAKLWLGYLLTLFALALPIAIWWPVG